MAEPSSTLRRPSRSAATAAYVGAVVVVAGALLAYAWNVDGLRLGVDLLLIAALAVIIVGIGELVVEGKVLLSLWSVLLLATQAIVGPVGAGLLGAVLGAMQGRRLAVRVRVFNAAQACATGVLGGLVYLAMGGSVGSEQVGPVGVVPVLRDIGLPLLAADVAQLLGNTALLAGVLWANQGHAPRAVTGPLLRDAGPMYVGYGFIAVLMVVLWRPAELGPAAAVMALAPLLIAQWAYRQHAEEIQGQQRFIDVLVAAVEVKAPDLAGHSARVSTLAATVAESLGLSVPQVSAVRTAGMLHDVGRTSVPSAVPAGATAEDDSVTYPGRSVALLDDLTFLSAALPAIRDHRAAIAGGGDADLAARVLGAVDEYDLLVDVGVRGGAGMTSEQALATLADTGVGPDVVAALRRVLQDAGRGDTP